jgi:hypothetical protein
MSGAIAGALLGVNAQVGMFVGGVEADYEWSDQSRSATALGIAFNDRISAFATIRGRAGVAPIAGSLPPDVGIENDHRGGANENPPQIAPGGPTSRASLPPVHPRMAAPRKREKYRC